MGVIPAAAGYIMPGAGAAIPFAWLGAAPEVPSLDGICGVAAVKVATEPATDAEAEAEAADGVEEA